MVIVTTASSRNFLRELKEELATKGHSFQTQTDTEVVRPCDCRRARAGQVARRCGEGGAATPPCAFAFAILFKSEPDLLIGARQGSPLAVGHGEGQMYLGSDAIALAPFTNRVTYLEDGDWSSSPAIL